MKVLVACEESQVVCMAFRKRGHEAYSCDTQDCSGGHPEWHIKDDVLKHLDDGWDLMIAHPPCTYLSYAGTRHWDNPGRIKKRLEALEFFRQLWEAQIKRICLENPRSCASPVIAKYTQIIQPHFFGDNDLKTTWLWLRNLQKLKYHAPTPMFNDGLMLPKPEPYLVGSQGKKHYFSEGKTRSAKVRSVTFQGIADAMADQWGNL